MGKILHGFRFLAPALLTIFFTPAQAAEGGDYLRDIPGPASLTLRSLGLKDGAIRESVRAAGAADRRRHPRPSRLRRRGGRA
jgi:hypothetical protein